MANPGAVPLERIKGQVARILSLDVDAAGFAEVGERDEVVRALQRRYPGLRPVQFYTPYEAVAWAIIGQRIRMTQAATHEIADGRRALSLPDRVDPASPR